MIAKTIILIISSIVLGFISFYVSMLLAWGRIVEVDDVLWLVGILIAIFVAISYRSIRDKSTSNISFGIRSFLLAIFVFPGIYFFGYGFIMGGIKEKQSESLNKSTNYICTSKEFSLPVPTIAIRHGDSYTTYTFYYITRNILHILNDYEDMPFQTDYIELAKYPKESRFIIDGYYSGRDYAGGSSYLLVRSLDDNRTMWLSANDFNHATCQLLFKKNYDNKRPKNLDFVSIDLSSMSKGAF